MKKLTLILILFCAVRSSQALLCSNQVCNAQSASLTHVAAAVAESVNGDIVNVPSGNVTWSSTLDLGSKAISLIGAGSNATIIANGAGTLIRSGNTGTNPVRISGFRFNSSNEQTPIVSFAGPAYKVRVDNCYFSRGDSAIGANYWPGGVGSGPVWGVVDHCTLLNLKRAYFAMDVRTNDGSSGCGPDYDGCAAWAEFLADNTSFPGSEKMMYFEQNTFTWDSASIPNAQSALHGIYAGKCCFRYNTTNGYDYQVDAHGDQPGQGTMYYEIYENTFNYGSFYPQGAAAWNRGGQWIMYNNNFNYPYTGVIKLSVYWTTDQVAHRVKNTYFWGNKINGNSTNQASLVSVIDSGQTPAGYSAANIRLNQEYFLHAPESGQTYYPYTAYDYPHPLTICKDGCPTPAPTATPTPTAAGTPFPTPTPTASPTPTPTPTPTPVPFGSFGIQEVGSGSKRANSGPKDNDFGTLDVPGGVAVGQWIVVGGAVWRTGSEPATIPVTAPCVSAGFSTKLTDELDPNSRTFIAIGKVTTAGACLVRVDPEGPNSDFSWTQTVFSGIHDTPDDVDGTSSTATSTSATDTITPSASALIIGVMSHTGGNYTLEPANGSTLIGKDTVNGNNQAYAMVYEIAPSATLQTLGVTLEFAAIWRMQTYSFKPAPTEYFINPPPVTPQPLWQIPNRPSGFRILGPGM